MAGTDRTREMAFGPSPSVVLVNPQLGENIGMAARAMANFGLMDLRLVTPREGWDKERAVNAASGDNLDQPDTAASLGAQKAKAVAGTGADVVASGNIGCLTQLKSHLAKQNSPVRVQHTMQVLRDAYRG